VIAEAIAQMFLPEHFADAETSEILALQLVFA
jgi:hypothetical protein